MSKRAPALGRKVKPGPIEHLKPPRPCPWCGLHHGSRYCTSYGTYVAATQVIPLVSAGRGQRSAHDT